MNIGGLILLRPADGAPLQFAATASFLSKLYSDYLDLLGASYMSCIFANPGFSLEKLKAFSRSQASAELFSSSSISKKCRLYQHSPKSSVTAQAQAHRL